MAASLNYEVGDYFLNNTALIPLNFTNINTTEVTIHLINSAVAEIIVLDFQGINIQENIGHFIIECLSQCSIEVLNAHNVKLNYLNLTNAALIKSTDLHVVNFYQQASESFKTSLPTVSGKAEIRILPSADMLAVQALLKGVNIIPGSGEYVYDTKLQQDRYNLSPINANNPDGIADALYNLKSLVRLCPNLGWTAPVVSWFGISTDNKLDIANINILPAVEHRSEKVFENWHVDSYDRSNAHEISKDSKNRPNYGGTVNDASLLRYIDALKEAGYKIMFYPMIFMDIPGKPWRGHISAGNIDQINEFFTKDKGYDAFILHYANLLKGKIDAFVIGSELRDLKGAIDNRYNYPDPKRYPAVVELIELARRAREILGANVTITYAADWSEYHHDKNGYHHLDPLWASPYIEVVGIDAYLPITSKSMGDITIDEIKQGWESGELWDFYYNSDKKEALSPEWGLKQIEHWWKSEHWAWSIQSQWQPKMKPIWFTEFGFPSMHMATNQPNIFYNPGSTDDGVPKKSSGKPDFALQMRAIRATLEYWQNKSDVVGNMFLWAWDARPYPAFPEKLDVWSDGNLWSRGHWINGKIEAMGRVTLIPGLNVSTLAVYAENLVIPGTTPSTTIGMIIANNAYLGSPIVGTDFGIRANKITMQEAINIGISGTLMLDSDNEITFASHKKVNRKSYRADEKTTVSYEDEVITSAVINAGKLIIKAPKLILITTKVSVKQIEWMLNDLALVSEAETHIYRWSFEGEPHWLTGSTRRSSGSEQRQEAVLTHINCESLNFELKNNLYAKGALIETIYFSGYAKNYQFETLPLERQSQSCSKDRKWAGFGGSKKTSSSNYDEYHHGAVLYIASKSYGFAESEILFLGSYLMGEEVELEADIISFKAAIGKHFAHFKLEETGIKFFASAGEGEVALGACAYYKQLKSDGYYEQATQAGAFVQKLKITTRILEREGGIISGANVTINASQIIDKSPVVISYYHFNQKSIEVGLKIGIQESITKAIAAGQNLMNNVGGNNPALVSAVNFVSNNYALFMQLTNIASGNAVQGGIWVYGEARSNHFASHQANSVANPINVAELAVNANYWHMQGLEGTGENWNLNVDKIEGEFSESSGSQKMGSGEIIGQVGLTGNIGTGASVQGSHYKTSHTTIHNNHINLSGRLNIHANRVTGALQIEAEDITAVVNVLKLLTEQDERHESSRAFSAHIGAVGGSITGAGAYGEKGRSDSAITNDGRSGLLARNLLIVKAEEFIYLEGAYLDSSNGNLRVEAAKITTKAITDTATGWAAGLGLDSGNSAFGAGIRIVAGEKDQARTVYGSIGKGVIILGDQEIDEAMSSLLGISRDTQVAELEGDDWKLDITVRKAYMDEIGKAWSGGIDGVTSRIIENAELAVNNAISPIVAIISATMSIMQQAFTLIADMFSDAKPGVDEQAIAEQIHEKLNSKYEINSNIDPEISGRNLAIAIIASKLIASGKFTQKEATGIADKLYRLGQAQNQDISLKPVSAKLIQEGFKACAVSPFCVSAVVYGIAAIGTGIAYLKDLGAKHIALDELEGHFDDKGNILSTPIHRDKGNVLVTPEHKPESADKGFEIPEYISKLPGFEPTKHGFKLPGFEVHTGDDMKILYQDDHGEYHSEYWDKYVEFKGNKVYQRDDLINPHHVRPDGKGTNLEAMQKGYAPIGPDGKPVNLHHLIQTNDGGIAECTQDFHQQYKRIIHINPSTVESGIDRVQFRSWRESYWQNRAKDFIK